MLAQSTKTYGLPIQILTPGPTGLNLRGATEKKKTVSQGLLRDA